MSSSESKDHAPSSRRLRQAREEGRAPKSTELSSALSLLCTLLAIIGTTPWIMKKIANFSLAVDRSFENLNIDTVQNMTIESLWLMGQLSLIPLSIGMVVFIISTWLQTGGILSFELIEPKLEHLNPVEGFKRLFSIRSLVQLGFILIKTFIIGLAVFTISFNVLGDAIRVIYADANAALTIANVALMNFLLWCGGLFALLGLLDFVYQRWQYLQDLRMSTSEIKREHRDDSGDPHLRSQRKELADEPMAREQLDYIHMASLVLHDNQGRVLIFVYQHEHYQWPVCIFRAGEELAQKALTTATQNKKFTVQDDALMQELYPAVRMGARVSDRHLPGVFNYIIQGLMQNLEQALAKKSEQNPS
jgi:flagellar biosynthesis protein FlhB